MYIHKFTVQISNTLINVKLFSGDSLELTATVIYGFLSHGSQNQICYYSNSVECNSV